MELDYPSTVFTPPTDQRSRMPEPPPVRLLTIDDAHLVAPAGSETKLDAFYAGILRFERDAESHFPIYDSENFRIVFQVHEPPISRQTLRPLGIIVPLLATIEQRLIEAEIEFIRQRGLIPGDESLTLLDPAGNWLEIAESREFR